MISSISTVCLLLILSSCQGKSPFYQKCADDTVDFATKVNNSSFVVYGQSTAKALDFGSDNTFHVTFRVDCIFKGSVVPEIINITQAGLRNGKRFCQDLSVGHGRIIVFLEALPVHDNDTLVFVPSDFVEVPVEGNSTYDILANTCNLQHLLPLNHPGEISEVCPAVSTDVKCHYTTLNYHLDSSTVEPGLYSHHINGIRGKSAQIDVDRSHGLLNTNTNVFLILMAIVVVRLN